MVVGKKLLYRVWSIWIREQWLCGNRESTRSSSFLLLFPENRDQLQWGSSFLISHTAVLLGALTAEQLFQGAHTCTTALLEHVKQRLCGADSEFSCSSGAALFALWRAEGRNCSVCSSGSASCVH